MAMAAYTQQFKIEIVPDYKIWQISSNM